jgi:hypothetical protein
MAGDLIFVLAVVLVVAVFAFALVRRGQRSTESFVEVESEGDGRITHERTAVLASRREAQYWNLVHQTAAFRYSVRWKGARLLLAEHGLAASDMIQTACDPGDDIHVTFVVRAGRGIFCDFLQDRQSREMVGVHEWEEFNPEAAANEDAYGYADEVLAVAILRDEHLRDAFDRAVLAYFDFHLRRDDRPLPPR